MRGVWTLAVLMPGMALAQEGGSPLSPVDEGAPAAPAPPDPALAGLAAVDLPGTGAEAAFKVPLHAPVPVVEMLSAAHWVVQGVSLLLGLGLFAVVTILIFKLGELWLVGHRLRASLRALARVGTLEEAGTALAGRRCPGAEMATAAMEEFGLARTLSVQSGVRDRLRVRLDRVAARAVSRLRRGTGVLATVAATAPFIGLFGTVWGIMSSFLAISAEGTTNLAVVAPGIAEALLVTGFGLVAAIPAVVVYNAVQRRVAGLRQGLADVAVMLEVLASRDLDRGLGP